MSVGTRQTLSPSAHTIESDPVPQATEARATPGPVLGRCDRVVLIGLDDIGVAIGQALERRTDCQLVAAIDPDPARTGRDLGAVLGRVDLGVIVGRDVADLASYLKADVAVVTTRPFLGQLEPTVVELLDRGLNVVSVCEELAYPQVSHPAIASRLDRLAKARGVSILGTGANPGFMMDTLPLVLSALTEKVERVEIRRTADLSGCGDVREQFGIGMTIDEFDEAQADGIVIGHVGFEHAAASLAHGLGWRLDDILVDPVRPAFVAPTLRRSSTQDVPAGTVAAVVHTARGYTGDKRVVDLTVHFGIFEPGDPVDSGDRWRIHGDHQLIELTAESGLDSLTSAVAITANMLPALVDAAPGLRTMGEFSAYEMASKGARRRLRGR